MTEDDRADVPPGLNADLLAFTDWVSASETGKATAEAADPESLFVVFVLNEDAYGLPVSSVREIVRVGEIRSVPQAPEHVRGVANVRGAVLPVLELRSRLGLAPLVVAPTARILVLEVAGRAVGMLVDRVTEVVKVRASQIETGGGGAAGGACRRGLARLPSGALVLLDPEKIVSGEAGR